MVLLFAQKNRGVKMDSKTKHALNSLSQKLKNFRNEKNWTINQLQEASNVSGAQISRIENGKQLNPKQDTIEKLAAALDIETTELVAEKDLNYVNKMKLRVGAVHTIWSAPLILMLTDAQEELAMSVVSFSYNENGQEKPLLQSATGEISSLEAGPEPFGSNCNLLTKLGHKQTGKKAYLASNLLKLQSQSDSGIDCFVSATISDDNNNRFIECATIMKSITGADFLFFSNSEKSSRMSPDDLNNSFIDAMKVDEELLIYSPEGTIAKDQLHWFADHKLDISRAYLNNRVINFEMGDIKELVINLNKDIADKRNVVVVLWEPYTSWVLKAVKEQIGASYYKTTLLELAGEDLGKYPIIEQKLYFDRYSRQVIRDADKTQKFIYQLIEAIKEINKLKEGGSATRNPKLQYLAEYFSLSPEECLGALKKCDFKVYYSVSWVHDYIYNYV